MLPIPGHLPSPSSCPVPAPALLLSVQPLQSPAAFAAQPCQSDSSQKQPNTMLHPTRTKAGLLILLKWPRCVNEAAVDEPRCLFHSVNVSFRQLQALKRRQEETSLEHIQFRMVKKSIPALRSPFQ